ncbi:hypothetical protein NLX83_13835 [Allokutzneria sp. A3M-2-11 16]|uniref:hypothetical protein n=1 Tax=Allokutzneria sp. A3M-2-11 16 TaxID=2962043 RepID=UPI0020B7FFC6|nr:hypothetical protein [Allokutzneria sp. A3M-2-11 16]MCP3800340.1 hypothetical protein [Allokutzneria sp. A3M-2-11 16]
MLHDLKSAFGDLSYSLSLFPGNHVQLTVGGLLRAEEADPGYLTSARSLFADALAKFNWSTPRGSASDVRPTDVRFLVCGIHILTPSQTAMLPRHAAPVTALPEHPGCPMVPIPR